MIRYATAQDAQAITRVRVAAIRELAVTAYSEEQIRAWAGGEKSNSCEAAIASKVVLVEELEGAIRAFAQLDPERGVIERVYVSPEYARQGAGARLLRKLEAIARERGINRLSIDATLNAVHFYAQAGYAAVEQCEHELEGGVVFRCVAMVKELCSGNGICATR